MSCAFCGSITHDILDMGEMAPAGAFLKISQFRDEKRHSLKLVYCESCCMAQLSEHIDKSALFGEYFYFSSQIASVRAHFKSLAEEISRKYAPNSLLEIGCNDGALLMEVAKYAKAIGVDPASNVTDKMKGGRITLINDFFTKDVAKAVVSEHGRQDVIVASNVFAHISDIHDATAAVKSSLSAKGVFIVEAHHVGDMLVGSQYDWIYHEHLYYYSCKSLSMHLDGHGLEIFDVKPIAMHGGSMRYYIAHKGEMAVSRGVRGLIELEDEHGINDIGAYYAFAESAAEKRDKLVSAISSIKASGKKVIGYGASGRANTIIQYCGFDTRHIDYILDDSTARQGVFTPGSWIPVKKPDSSNIHADYTVIFAWPYANEIIEKTESDVILPLPEVVLVRND